MHASGDLMSNIQIAVTNNIPSTLPIQRHFACHSNMHVTPHSLYLSSTVDGKPHEDNNRLSGDETPWQSVGLATLQSDNSQNTHN